MTQDKAQAAGAVSIDSPEFLALLNNLMREYWNPETHVPPIIAFADAHAAQRYEAGQHDKDGNHVDDLRAWLDESQAALDKANTALWSTSLKLQESEASLARLVEGVVALRKRSLLVPGMHNSVIEGMSALLPAKAEAPTLICQRCDTDRLKAPCPISGDLCSVARADAHLLATPAYDFNAHEEGRHTISGTLPKQHTICATPAPAMSEESIKSLAENPYSGTDLANKINYLGLAENAAMGEDLPLSDEDAKIIATFERHIDKDLDASPGVTSYWIKQSEVVEAVRACMALRQSGAVEVGSLTKEQRDIIADAMGAVHLKNTELAYEKLRTLLATPAAPVSQPAAQEPRGLHAAILALPVGEESNCATDRSLGYTEGFMACRTAAAALAAPAPLSAPAGSEQERGSLTCPNCGTDRMKSPCPRTVHECPMIGHAQQEQSK